MYSITLPKKCITGQQIPSRFINDDSPLIEYNLYVLIPSHRLFVVYLTLTDPLRIQPWSQDRRNQTKSNRESEISRESRQKRTDKKVASKGHGRDKIQNTNKNTQTVEANWRQPHKNAGKVWPYKRWNTTQA